MSVSCRPDRQWLRMYGLITRYHTSDDDKVIWIFTGDKVLHIVIIYSSFIFNQEQLTMADQMHAPRVAFQHLLTRFGFSPPAIQGIIANGIMSTRDLIGIDSTDIENIVKIIRASTVPPMLVSYVAQKRLTVLCYWTNRRQRLGETIDELEFTPEAMEAFSKLMSYEQQEDETTTVKPPTEFTVGSKWKPFKEGAIAFFNSQKGRGQIPLAYIIRNDAIPDPNDVYDTEHQRLIAVTPLQGIEFGEDNGKVFDHLKSWTLKGPAWTWMRQYNSTRDGRGAWLALLAHFEGDAQRDRVKDQAYSAIAAAKYHGEKKKFSFETYVTIHQEAFEDLEQYGEHISEEKRVRDLLQGIKDPTITAAKEAILANPNLRGNFSNAVTHLATSLQLNLSLQENRNVSGLSSAGRGRGRGRGGGGRGRGGRGRGRGGRNIYLGSYSPEQWRKLSADDKKRVQEGRAKSAEQRSQTITDPNSRIAASVITADQDAQSALTLPTALIDPTSAGIIPSVATGNPSLGDKRSNPENAGSHMSRRRLNRIMSGPRRTKPNGITKDSQRMLFRTSTNSVYHGTCELDSHADTCVAGPNSIVLEYTDQTANVSAFSDHHDVMKDVPIGTAATAYDNPQDGSTIILILHQALLMNDKVDNTLLCPNQLRANGLVVDDVPMHLAPYWQPSTHSIFSPEDDIQLPLTLHGVISLIETRTPTQEELDTCKWVVLTSDMTWDPHSSLFHENECLAATTPDPKDRVLLPIKTYHSNLRLYDNDLLGISSIFDDSYSRNLNISMTNTTTRTPRITPELLSQRWGIGLQAAKDTLKVTTQKGIRHISGPLERRLRTRQAQLRYKQLSGRHGRFYTDTFFPSVSSISGKSMAQIYTNDISFTKIYPMSSKSDTADTLLSLIHHVGIPSAIHSDDAKEITQGKFRKLCNEYEIPVTTTEPYSPWQNRAEGAIRELKRHAHRKMKARNVPQKLWDFCCRWSCDVRSKTVSNNFMLEGRTPYEIVLGTTPDISSLIDYDFYEPVWYYDEVSTFPAPKRLLARWLGEAHSVGQAMCYYILPPSGIPIARSSVQPVSPEERQTDNVIQELAMLDDSIKNKFGNPIKEDIPDYFSHDGQENMPPDYTTPQFEPVEEGVPEADEWDPESFDQYISAQIVVPKGDQHVLGTVIGRKHDIHGNPIGKANSNPIFDTRIYQVQLPDGHVEEFTANVIAECLYSQVDDEGRQYVILDDIIDYKVTDESLAEEEKFQISSNGNIHHRRTTKGWKLCVLWKDGSTSWEALKDMKEAFPIQVAEFAVSQGIQDRLAFRWWVPTTLRRYSRIVKAVKSRYEKKTHKYGIRVPRSIEEAYDIDKETGTDYWHQAILKEMKNNMIAFKFLEEGEQVPVGSKWIPFHMIFDVKIDLTRKARFVAGGHWTDASSQLTYSSVVTRESVRIAFLIAALNDLDILAADVGNAYLQAPAREKVHTTAGPEFGPHRIGQTVIVVRAMYGLKSSGAAWHAQLSSTLQSMDFTPSLADPDVWIRAAAKPNGYEYYEYILVYVDDLLVISHDPSKAMKTIQLAYRLKEEPTSPKTYLGANIKDWYVPGDSRRIWSMNCQHYIKEAIRCLEVELNKSGMTLKGKPNTPMQTSYRPELDVSPLLDPDQANYYASLIGILRWAIELGRIDIYIDVSLLSSHLAQPRVGHMQQVLHIFAYLKCHEQSTIVFDPNPIVWDECQFQKYDWKEFYGDITEPIPPNAPPPRGNAVQINAFVDADHAGNKLTRRSQTGILIYLNRAPILWYSKAQNTVESSTFGSEFIAMRIGVEMIEALRYKLRMFGIPIEGPANVFCDNKSVVTNSTIPTSTLKKKHNSIAYHRVRESVAANIIRIAKVHSKENLADLFTKPLGASDLKYLVQRILW
jgi:hypothetical protein